MERSPPPMIQPQSSSVTVPNSDKCCIICNEKMSEGQDCLIISECNHAFHRSCIEEHLSNTSECPSCKRPCLLAELKTINIQEHIQISEKSKRVSCKPRGAMAKQYHTRSNARNLFGESQTPSVNLNGQSTNQNIPEASPISQRPQSFSPQTNRRYPNYGNGGENSRNLDQANLNYLIENTVTRLLQNLNFIPPQNVTHTQNIQPPASQHQTPFRNVNNIPQARSSLRQNFNNSSFDDNFAIRADKITSIIQNWNVKFDGSSNGIGVDEFLYRVRTLTRENFNNDFSLICRNLHILLAGKARDWYWRYHKQVDVVEWREFCSALKYQYKEFKSSFDIHEEIRNRKMKPNESFESFYESICSMLDKLSTPIPESDLVEILTRNLRPEIRHELLYVPVYSIAHLRKLVQMREHLMESDLFRKNISNRFSPNYNGRRQVAEVEGPGELNSLDHQPEPEISVDAIQKTSTILKCWNCDEPGHHWEDCLESRNIFCYGCGIKNTYKPQCTKCTNKKLSISKNQMAQSNVRNYP